MSALYDIVNVYYNIYIYLFFVFGSSFARSSGMSLSRTAVDAGLRQHVKICTRSAATCPCASFANNFLAWAVQLPLHESVPGETWLWYKLLKNSSGVTVLTWCCVACDASAHASAKYRQARDLPSELKISNLKDHQQSPNHKKAVAEVFSLASDDLQYTAPSLQLFKELIEAFQKGAAPTAGYKLRSGDVGVKKANQMLWCSDQAVREIRLDTIRRGSCTCIMRDERHNRMHLRYSIGSFGKRPRSGFLGQSREHKPDSIGIAEATVEIYKDACTKFSNPPPGANVTPFFDETAYDNLTKTTEAIAIDSAENEVCSVSDMTKLPMFPARLFVLRDLTHAFRRVLTRLWKADQTMGDCFGFFCHWKESPAQMIQHSGDMRRAYGECTQQSSSAATASKFTHMRAAKHRVETMLSPLSRSVLDPDGLLGFAQRISIEKKGQVPGKAMDTFLTTISGQLFLLAAMMADGAVEAMELIRFVDTEKVPMSGICAKVKLFLDHIYLMFFEDGVYQVNGHTSFIIQWYESRTHYITVGGQVRAFGGVKFTDAQKQSCIAHLQTWVLLVKPTVEAEFPSFNVINAFSVFWLPRDRTVRLNLDTDKEAFDKLNRLSIAFKQPTLVDEFKQRWRFALAAYADTSFNCSNWEAWCRDLDVDLFCGLANVICRGETYCPVTSGVEQSFSKVNAVLGQNRLNANSGTENLAVNLAVTKLSRSDIQDVAVISQNIWRLAFDSKHSRVHLVPRRDAGIPKPPSTCSLTATASGGSGAQLTERKFLKRIRDEVDSSAQPGSSSRIADQQAPIWTGKHQHELDFQKNKHHKRTLEACLPSCIHLVVVVVCL